MDTKRKFRPRPELQNNLRQAREELGLSKEAMADLMGVGFATIDRWERGICAPSAEKLQMFPACYGKRLADLFPWAVA